MPELELLKTGEFLVDAKLAKEAGKEITEIQTIILLFEFSEEIIKQIMDGSKETLLIQWAISKVTN